MNILNEKKEVTPIITPSLGYKLRSINWNEDFYFDNPIDKEKIKIRNKQYKHLIFLFF